VSTHTQATHRINPIPDRYRRINACLIVDGAAWAIDWPLYLRRVAGPFTRES
jgi:hypothetical protein